MVDISLPLENKDRRLRYLFLDLNSYFASVEQQERPELRGKPTAVVPVMADSSFVIAASYEAKRFGIKTGTQIGEAKQMCPDLQLVDGRHSLYAAYHRRVLEAVENVLPIEEVCSIDEMRFRLIGTETTPQCAVELAQRLKETIYERVGECLTCSVGIAPNSFLAKVGTELQKPNGLVTIEASDLPEKLYTLKLTDFPGINRRMKTRLNAAGIFTTQDMCEAERDELGFAFGSIIGERWWYLLRGYDLGHDTHDRKSLGHSHVLPPEKRTDQGCREVLLRLLHKASARLRANGLWAGGMAVTVGSFKKSWSVKIKVPPTQDTVTLTEHLVEAWASRDFVGPRSVAVTFYDLKESSEVTPSLFDSTVDRSLFSHAVDGVNKKFGKNKVYLAGLEGAKDAAQEKIAFNKTWLFSEGKDDNEWIDTFRGISIEAG
jgi:DNA polymerase IV